MKKSRILSLMLAGLVLVGCQAKKPEDKKEQTKVETTKNFEGKTLNVVATSEKYKKLFDKFSEETKAKVVLFTSNREMEKDPRVDLCIDWEYKDLVQNHPVLYQLLIERIAIAYQNKYGFPMEK